MSETYRVRADPPFVVFEGDEPWMGGGELVFLESIFAASISGCCMRMGREEDEKLNVVVVHVGREDHIILGGRDRRFGFDTREEAEAFVHAVHSAVMESGLWRRG